VRFLAPAGIVLALASLPVCADLEELFSRYVQVLKPRGPFVQQLIKVSPGSGDGWRSVDDPRHGLALAVPESADVDAAPKESRVFQAVLDKSATRPRPVFRVDVFPAGKDEPDDVDLDYLKELVDAYPEQTFGGRFSVTDSGMVVMKKTNLAMVGGVGVQGGARSYRMQWSTLSKEQHVFLTFDCAEGEWDRYADTVARILLSFTLTRKTKATGKKP
jgi:hypothetical protein